MTSRSSGTLDLATMFRLFAGDDITPQFGGVSSEEETRYAVLENQVVVAAVEKREKVATLAAKSPPA